MLSILAIKDVAIAIGRAGADLQGVRLCGAHGHAEPECRVQLEAEGLSGARNISWPWLWVGGELEGIGHLVSRTRAIRVEQSGWLVVPDIVAFSKNLLRVLYFCTGRAPSTIEGLVGRGGWCGVSGGGLRTGHSHRQRNCHCRNQRYQDTKEPRPKPGPSWYFHKVVSLTEMYAKITTIQ